MLSIDLPEQDAADWVSTHQRIEEPADLVRAPDELTLNSRQDEFAVMDSLDCFSNWNRRLKGHMCSTSLSFCGLLDTRRSGAAHSALSACMAQRAAKGEL
jgi:hypothetical protein